MKRAREDDTRQDDIIITQTIYCNFPPCIQLEFTNYQEYESHVVSTHDYICESCQKPFPNQHFLLLHIDEHHNPLLQIKRDRGDRTYGCFNETCQETFLNPNDRQTHLIEIHNYPKDYPFDIINNGI